MVKKIFIAIIVILLLGAGVVAYFLLFSKEKQDSGDPGSGFSLQDLFPFGSSGNGDSVGSTGNQNGGENIPEGEPSETVRQPRLMMITKGPIAGAHIYNTTREIPPEDPKKLGPDGKPVQSIIEPATKARFVEAATGHTNETYLDLVEVYKLTNTTIPKISEAVFGGKEGQTPILRYAEQNNTIQTFAGNIAILGEKDGTPDRNLRGSYLAENIVTIAVSPEKEKIFTVAKSDNGVVGNISQADGTKKSQIFSIAFTEWVAQWPNTRYVTVTTKSAAKVPGYMYSIDTTTKSMKKVIGGIPGLTTLTSPDMKSVLFSRSANGSITSSVYNLNSKSALSLPGATTLPEKCVWQSNTVLYCAVPSYMPNAQYPDAWYQGGVSFTDQIYKIDMLEFSSEVIGLPSIVNATIDAINLAVDPDNTFLIFTNKKDGSLWSLDLRPESNIFTQ